MPWLTAAGDGMRLHGKNMRGKGSLFALRALLTSSCLLPAFQAEAAGLGDASISSSNLLLLLLCAGVLGFAAMMMFRKSQREKRLQMALSDLESRLNETESALASDPQVLIVWHGKQDQPALITNTLKGEFKIPAAQDELLEFAVWLEADSLSMLNAHLDDLRQNGKAFNFGIRSKDGELIEADGRAAGGMAALRLRPLAGERRQITELSYDARKLGLQVGRLSAVLDVAPLPIWLRSNDGKLNWVNRAYVKAVEMPNSETVLKSGIEIAQNDRLDRSRSEAKQGLVGRAHTVLGGTMRALNIHEISLTEGRAGFAVDVSDLEHLEKELDRLIKAHASTLDKLDTAIAVFGPDQRLRFYNAAYAQLWPIDPQWLDQHPTDGEILDRLRSQRCIPEQANYREWKAKQLSSYTTLDPSENWWYLPDGRSLHVVCEQHPFGGVTYLYQNVTKAIQLESRYNQLIDVQRETLDNLDEAVALFGSDGRLKLFNPAFRLFWNFSEDMLVSEPHIDQIISTIAARGESSTIWQDLKFAVTGLESEGRALHGRLKAGERILHYSLAPLPDGNALLTFADISDPAKMEQALRERAEALEAADHLKNTFLSNISYEIRTPLTSILGFAEALNLGMVGKLSAKQKEYVVDIKRSSEDLKTIIDAIIDLSAIDAGAMELKLSQLTVLTVIEQAAARLADDLSRRDQTLNIEIADEKMSLIADAVRVEQIVHNLLSNAIGFSANGATVRLGARKAGGMVQIWVADTGPGIDPEFQKKAFERFQARSQPGSHRGPGLGLPIVKSFTELHGGEVRLVSKPGQGTTVVCSFPQKGPAETPLNSTRAA